MFGSETKSFRQRGASEEGRFKTSLSLATTSTSPGKRSPTPSSGQERQRLALQGGRSMTSSGLAVTSSPRRQSPRRQQQRLASEGDSSMSTPTMATTSTSRRGSPIPISGQTTKFGDLVSEELEEPVTMAVTQRQDMKRSNTLGSTRRLRKADSKVSIGAAGTAVYAAERTQMQSDDSDGTVSIGSTQRNRKSPRKVGFGAPGAVTQADDKTSIQSDAQARGEKGQGAVRRGPTRSPTEIWGRRQVRTGIALDPLAGGGKAAAPAPAPASAVQARGEDRGRAQRQRTRSRLADPLDENHDGF